MYTLMCAMYAPCFQQRITSAYVCVWLRLLVCSRFWLVASVICLLACLLGQMDVRILSILNGQRTEKCASNYIQQCEHRRKMKTWLKMVHTRTRSICRCVHPCFFSLLVQLLSSTLLLLFLGVLFPSAICAVWKKSSSSSSSHSTQMQWEKHTIKILLA